MSSREKILAAAKVQAQTRGYGGLNFRTLAEEVGINAASIYHHFASKADLGAAVAKRYREDAAAVLESITAAHADDPKQCLRRYPGTFRAALENGNRLCLCSFMAAEYDDLPEPVKNEVQAFADVNVAWLAQTLVTAALAKPKDSERRARAIYAAVAGAQLMARSRADVSLFDEVIESYRAAGIIPA